VKSITGPQLCRKLELAGWTMRRIRGSHYIFTKPGERKTLAVPVHGNAIVKLGLATRVAKDGGIEW